ncbi:MAB_1171c family putative transporter [Streptomyces sp. NPDC004232]|uniref:MAB_1171c family putative transporter n=1 Tax=Streptomyces sp. NPDC004232 TaxID=3154454 RepID=UPI0033BC0549
MSHGPDNTVFYICGTSLLLICLLKIPTLLRRRRDLLLSAVVLLLFDGALVFFFAAPDSIAAINRATGVANFAAPMAYSAMALFGGASLLLIINWRPAPPEQTRRLSQACVVAYGLVIVAINVLFWVGHAPVEQLTLFDGYYASTPFIREMILTYLVGQGVGTMATSILCWRWSKEVRGSLRAGLRVLAPGYLLHVCYDVIKLVAIFGFWTGHRWDFLIDQVAPQAAAPSATLVVCGFGLPLAGPRLAQSLQSLRQLRELSPLWRELRQVPTPGAIRTSIPWWSSPAVRLTRRKTSIYDALLALAPHCDAAVHDQAFRAARDHGDDQSAAEATADAAMIVVARLHQCQTGSRPDKGTDADPWRPRDLIPLSRALSSPIVSSLREHPGTPVESSTHD